MPYLLFLHFLLTALLCGLIWTVQLVHYPLFRFIDEAVFTQFLRLHMAKISLLVVPWMIGELFLSIFLYYQSRVRSFLGVSFSQVDLKLYMLILMLLTIAVWGWTFAVNSPAHLKLLNGKSLEQVNSLVLGNWPRTILWTIKLSFFMRLFFVYFKRLGV